MAEATGCGTRSPLYLIGDAASRRGLSRVGYFITLNGPLNGHPPSYVLSLIIKNNLFKDSKIKCQIKEVLKRVNIGSFRVRSTNGLRVTPPISMKFGTLADNA